MRPEKARTSPFGVYLWQQRKELGYSVTKLAEKAGISASSVTDLELGRRRLTGPMARKLAGPLDLRPNELLIRANVTPEFPWAQLLPSTETLSKVTVSVTEEEKKRIREYLHFLRFRNWFFGSPDKHPG